MNPCHKALNSREFAPAPFALSKASMRFIGGVVEGRGRGGKLRKRFDDASQKHGTLGSARTGQVRVPSRTNQTTCNHNSSRSSLARLFLGQALDARREPIDVVANAIDVLDELLHLARRDQIA